MPDILDGTIAPGKVFDVSTSLDGVPSGYQDMADRKATARSASSTSYGPCAWRPGCTATSPCRGL